MAKTKDKVTDAAGNVKPYVERALHDEELRDNVRNAYQSARSIYDELIGNRGLSGVATRGATDKDIQGGRRPAHHCNEPNVLRVVPALEVGRRVDGAVVPESEQPDRVDLEVQVERGAERVTRVAHEAEYVARLNDRAVDRVRRIRRKVCVIELVALVVTQPEPPAADLVPADGEDRAVCDGEDRRAEGSEDVVAVI